MRYRPLTLLALLTACAGGVKSADTVEGSGSILAEVGDRNDVGHLGHGGGTC